MIDIHDFCDIFMGKILSFKGGWIMNRISAVFTMVLVLFLSTCVLANAQETGQNLRVEDAAIATEVTDLTPQGVSDSFPPTVSKLYAFTRIVGAEGETTVKHLWFYQDRLMAEVELPVRSPSWRTYSSKNILPSWTGNWRVDITDEAGNLLKSLEFTVE